METTRLETFSDGVFAIAATLLILDVHRAGGSVAHGLLHARPSYVTYAISFLTIGIIWVNHHTVMAQSLRDGSHAGAFAYGLTFTLMAISYAAMWSYASAGGRLLRQEADPRIVSGITRSFRPGAIACGLATVAALVPAYLAVALFGAIALFYVLESSLFGRDA